MNYKLNPRTEIRLARRLGKVIAGMDEAGRGPIAGPVAVAMVAINANFFKKIPRQSAWWRKVYDSKKIPESLREKIYPFITNNCIWSVALVNAPYIDKHGINKAINNAARNVINKIKMKPELVLIDGNRKFFPEISCHQHLIKKGDAKIFSIACASILAKVTRDRYMRRLSQKWPRYGFSQNKGYGTRTHLSLLARYGPCPEHRRSFAPLKNRGL